MLHRFLLASGLAFAFVSLSSLARAEAPPPRAAPATESYWYGWQTLSVDAASVTMAFAAKETSIEPLGYSAAAGVFLGAPVVHLAHDRPGIAFASLGLRLGLPSIAGAIGYASRGPCPESKREGFFGCAFHGWSEAAVGGLIGLGAAMAIDAAFLAHGERPVTPPRESGMPRFTSFAPSYDPSTRSAALGVGGTF